MVTLTLTETEFNALVGLIDAGVRATGLRAVKDAAPVLEKLEEATKAAQAAAVAAPTAE